MQLLIVKALLLQQHIQQRACISSAVERAAMTRKVLWLWKKGTIIVGGLL
jgi:hypothetical protein